MSAEQTPEQIQKRIDHAYVGEPRNQWLADIRWLLDQLAERDQRIAELEEENNGYRKAHEDLGELVLDNQQRAERIAELTQDLNSASDGAGVIDALQQRIAKLEHAISSLREPCNCDPVGSGEEYCNGGCILSHRIAELESDLDGRAQEELRYLDEENRADKDKRIAELEKEQSDAIIYGNSVANGRFQAQQERIQALEEGLRARE